MSGEDLPCDTSAVSKRWLEGVLVRDAGMGGGNQKGPSVVELEQLKDSGGFMSGNFTARAVLKSDTKCGEDEEDLKLFLKVLPDSKDCRSFIIKTR